MKRYTRSLYDTSARDTKLLNAQTVCGFCSYGGHVRRNCVLRERLADEIVVLSNTFYRKKHELRQTQSQQKQMREFTYQRIDPQQQFGNIDDNNIQQRSLDTKVQPNENSFVRNLNDTNLRKYQMCANIFAPPPALSTHATNQRIALLYEMYLARIQLKSPLEPLGQNLICAADQSTTHIIEWSDCFENHDLGADLKFLFNDSIECGYEPEFTIREDCTVQQSNGKTHPKITYIDISGVRMTSFSKMTGHREVYFDIFNIATTKNSFVFAGLNHSIFICLAHNLEFNYSNETVSNRIYSSQIQRNWKTRKRKIRYELFLRQFIRIDDNHYCHSSSDNGISILVNFNSVALSFTII